MLIAYTAGTKQSDAPSPVCCDEISDSLLHLLLQTQRVPAMFYSILHASFCIAGCTSNGMFRQETGNVPTRLC